MSDTTPTAPTETDPNATDNAAGAADNFADGSQLARCTLIDASLVSSRMKPPPTVPAGAGVRCALRR